MKKRFRMGRVFLLSAIVLVLLSPVVLPNASAMVSHYHVYLDKYEYNLNDVATITVTARLPLSVRITLDTGETFTYRCDIWADDVWDSKTFTFVCSTPGTHTLFAESEDWQPMNQLTFKVLAGTDATNTPKPTSTQRQSNTPSPASYTTPTPTPTPRPTATPAPALAFDLTLPEEAYAEEGMALHWSGNDTMVSSTVTVTNEAGEVVYEEIVWNHNTREGAVNVPVDQAGQYQVSILIRGYRGSGTAYQQTLTGTMTVYPKKGSLEALKKPEITGQSEIFNLATGEGVIRWEAVPSVTGYVVQYSRTDGTGRGQEYLNDPKTTAYQLNPKKITEPGDYRFDISSYVIDAGAIKMSEATRVNVTIIDGSDVPVLMGDANDDGTVTLSDVQAILRYLADGTPINLRNAAVCDGETVTMQDAVAVLEMLCW